MLIRFNFKNFLSFDNSKEGKTNELSMIAGKVRQKSERICDDGSIKLLKLAAVFGSNASGKSNFVKAFDFMKKAVVSGLPQGYTEYYCKANNLNQEKDSYFEVEIKLGNKYYAYGFEFRFDRGDFVSEWLVQLENNKETIVFTRSIDSGFEFGEFFKSNEAYSHLRVYSEDIKEDNSVLFLSIMNKNKNALYTKYPAISVFKDVYDWFDVNLSVTYPNHTVSGYSYILKNENIDYVCDIISAFGTGIKELKRVRIDEEAMFKNIPPQLKKMLLSDIENRKIDILNNKIKESGVVLRNRENIYIVLVKNNLEVVYETINFSHENQDVLFRLSEESDGTVRLLDLMEILLSDENRVFVVDELDRCLHPSLTYKFIELFVTIATKKNIQLIVTTHESRLLDFDLLRRDEIWFTNKNEKGESVIYSLDEFNERFDKKIDKAYLDGRYGGVPVFNTLFPIGEV